MLEFPSRLLTDPRLWASSRVRSGAYMLLTEYASLAVQAVAQNHGYCRAEDPRRYKKRSIRMRRGKTKDKPTAIPGAGCNRLVFADLDLAVAM